MHVIITDIRSSSSRTIEMGAKRITALVLLVLSAAFIAAVVSYHAFLRLGEQNDWAIVKSISAVADAREVDAQNRYLRENLDVMAKRLGELQARLVQLDSLGRAEFVVTLSLDVDLVIAPALPGDLDTTRITRTESVTILG